MGLSASFPKSVAHGDGATGPTPETDAVFETASVLSDSMPHLRNDALGLPWRVSEQITKNQARNQPSGFQHVLLLVRHVLA